MVITRGLGNRRRLRHLDKDMERIVDYVIEAIKAKLKEKGWDQRKLAIRLERPGDEEFSEEDEEKRIKRNEVWLSRKIGKNVKETRKLSVEDLRIIARALDSFPSDFFPKRLEDEICNLPLTEFIRNICRHEIKSYLNKDNDNNNNE